MEWRHRQFAGPALKLIPRPHGQRLPLVEPFLESAMPAIDHPPLHLQATAGQALTIALPSIPGSGVIWQLPAAPTGCSLTEADSQASGAGMGGESRQQFVLTCDAAGQHDLRFELKRPGESVLRAVQPVRVTVG